MVNFQIARYSFQILHKDHICDVEVGDSSGGMNAIYSRPEVADGIISIDDVDTFGRYACVKLWKSTWAINVMRRRRLVHLSLIFGVAEQKCLTYHATSDEALESSFLQSCKPFFKSIEPLSRNHDPKMTQYEHTRLCDLLPIGEVVSGRNVKTVDGCLAVNFEVASCSSFRRNITKAYIVMATETTTVGRVWQN